MTRRRTPISIYDYPEHLNPFREDVDEGEDIRYHTTGRRRSSFRVNAWSVFAGRGKSPERSTPSPVASRFLTWTPQLLRRASFRRMITATAPPEHKNALSPPPRTLPARPPIPTHINCTSISSPAPVPAVRTRRLAQRAGAEDETKYIQQGAKPKKKRRAPAPPTPHPGRASQPQEPEASCSATQEHSQSSGGEESATTRTSVECYVEQSGTSPAESEETSVTSSEAAAEVQLSITQSNNSLAVSEDSHAESREASGQPMNESAPVVSEEPTEVVSQDVIVDSNSSRSSSAEESVEIINGEKELTIADQSAVDMDHISNSESTIQETKIVYQEQSDTAESHVNHVSFANEVEQPLQGNTGMEHTEELVEDVSVSSTERTSEAMENKSEESPLRNEEIEDSNSLTDMKEHVNTEEEKNDTPLENGFSGSDSEISPSKTRLIDEESKPLPKPRTILPEKPTEQDKKP